MVSKPTILISKRRRGGPPWTFIVHNDMHFQQIIDNYFKRRRSSLETPGRKKLQYTAVGVRVPSIYMVLYIVQHATLLTMNELEQRFLSSNIELSNPWIKSLSWLTQPDLKLAIQKAVKFGRIQFAYGFFLVWPIHTKIRSQKYLVIMVHRMLSEERFILTFRRKINVFSRTISKGYFAKNYYHPRNLGVIFVQTIPVFRQF